MVGIANKSLMSAAKRTILGLMSGTSLDGIDMALCSFQPSQDGLDWQIYVADTFEYPQKWLKLVSEAHRLNSEDLLLLHHSYGNFTGEMINAFFRRHDIDKSSVDAVSVHGHTIFHQPEKKLTFQLGHGASIAAKISLPVICDFRTQDMVLGGQGAPLVPIGDRLLFGAYDYCLNIGGIANISMEQAGYRLAWDICPANMVLNYLSRKIDLIYDENGDHASQGRVDEALLALLNNLSYYAQKPPKTLGREWVEREIYPLLEHSQLTVKDQLATFIEHIAMQTGRAMAGHGGTNLLITGGGAYNKYLVHRLNKSTGISVILPEARVIEYKEALIFALLGYLRLQNQTNILGSSTGARKDHISGIIYKI